MGKSVGPLTIRPRLHNNTTFSFQNSALKQKQLTGCRFSSVLKTISVQTITPENAYIHIGAITQNRACLRWCKQEAVD